MRQHLELAYLLLTLADLVIKAIYFSYLRNILRWFVEWISFYPSVVLGPPFEDEHDDENDRPAPGLLPAGVTFFRGNDGVAVLSAFSGITALRLIFSP